MSYIKLGDKEYPISFAHAALVRFCGHENIPFMKMDEEFEKWESWTPERFFALVFFALKEGARKERTSFDLDLDDVIELVLSNQEGVIQQIMSTVSDSMPQESKKKGSPQRPKKVQTRT